MYLVAVLGLLSLLFLISDNAKIFVARSIVNMISIILSMKGVSATSFLQVEDRFIKVSHQRGTFISNFIVPYNRQQVARMSQYVAHLVKDDHSTMDITQYPGIPYSMCAREMGGCFIEVHDQESGHGHVYDGETAPGYCEELIIDEKNE